MEERIAEGAVADLETRWGFLYIFRFRSRDEKILYFTGMLYLHQVSVVYCNGKQLPVKSKKLCDHKQRQKYRYVVFDLHSYKGNYSF